MEGRRREQRHQPNQHELCDQAKPCILNDCEHHAQRTSCGHRREEGGCRQQQDDFRTADPNVSVHLSKSCRLTFRAEAVHVLARPRRHPRGAGV